MELSHTAIVFLQLGGLIAVFAVVCRAVTRVGLSPIPLYLLVGVALRLAGIENFVIREEFIDVGADVGAILLLLSLGVEFSGDDLRSTLRGGIRAGVADIAIGAVPGVAAALLLGFGPLGAIILGGVTYISASTIVSKSLEDLGRLGNGETPTILGVIVFEDIAMAVYLPLVAVLLGGAGLLLGAGSLVLALGLVAVVFWVAVRHGERLSNRLISPTDEASLFSVLALGFLVAGVAESLLVSAAVGAFLVGIALSGPIQASTRRLVSPVRDLFAALFFLFFGLQIDPETLPQVAVAAVLLAVVAAATKAWLGWWAAGEAGVGARGRVRAGAALVARGEFSIIIAELGVEAELDPRLGPLAAAFVLLLAVVGPLLMRYGEQIAGPLLRRKAQASGSAGSTSATESTTRLGR